MVHGNRGVETTPGSGARAGRLTLALFLVCTAAPATHAGYGIHASGWVQEWALLGPFAGDNMNDHIAASGGCGFNRANIDPSPGNLTAGLTWTYHNIGTTTYGCGAAPAVNFGTIYGGDYRSAFAHSYIWCPSTRTVQIRTGRDDAILVYLDGVLVINNPSAGGCDGIDQDISGSLTLTAGWHRLMVQNRQITGPWMFRLRFTNTSGTPQTELAAVGYRSWMGNGGGVPVSADGTAKQYTMHDWLLLGPFGGSSNANHCTTDFIAANGGGNQENVVPKVGLVQAGKTWTNLRESGIVNFSAAGAFLNFDLLSPNESATAYVHTYAYNPGAPVSAEILIGSDDSGHVWVNGTKVLTACVARGSACDQSRSSTFTLNTGDNRILFRVDEGGGAFNGQCRMVKPGTADPLPGITFQIEQTPEYTVPVFGGSISPSTTTSKTPNIQITVQDTQSGLDVSTAQYSYSTDGGATWSIWMGHWALHSKGTAPAGPTNWYWYPDMSKPNYTIVSGDVFEYDVYYPTTSQINGGMELEFNTGCCLRSTSITDQNGIGAHPATTLWPQARQKWYHRTFNLSTLAGTVITAIEMAHEIEGAVSEYYVRNVQIVNGSRVKVLAYQDASTFTWPSEQYGPGNNNYSSLLQSTIDPDPSTTTSCTGINGTTAVQTITATGVPFNQISPTQNKIRFRMTDWQGNFAISPVFNVAILCTAPTAVCQNVTRSLDVGGTVSISGAEVNNGSTAGTGGCTISTHELAKPGGAFAPSISFNCSEVGPNTVTLRVTQTDGQQATCTATVNIIGTCECSNMLANGSMENPSLGTSCPTAGSAPTAWVHIGNGDAAARDRNAHNAGCTPSANGGHWASSTGSHAAGTTAIRGYYQIVPGIIFGSKLEATGYFRAGNDAGGTVTAKLEIRSGSSLDGNGRPNGAVLASADIPVNGSWNFVRALVATATTSSVTVVWRLDNTGATQTGATSLHGDGIRLFCTTACGPAPTALCHPTLTRALNGSGQVTVSTVDVDNGSAAGANCELASLRIRKAGGSFATSVNFGCSEKGNNTVTLRYTQSDGQFSECTSTVIVQDNQGPALFCPANVTVPVNSGQCVATGVQIGSATTSDNCPGVTTSNNAPSSYPLGETFVTWTATDAAGNTASACTQKITVVDNQLPTITCPSNVVVNLNGPCQATGVNLGTPTTSDNCPNPNASSDAPSAFPIGNTAVVWTVTDSSGNTARCTQTVTVNDQSGVCPVNCPNPTAVCHGTLSRSMTGGSASILAVEFDNGSTPSGNCTIAKREIRRVPGSFLNSMFVSCSDVGHPITAELKITQSDGKTATMSGTINVVDNTPPTMTFCPSDRTVSADAGTCAATNVSLGQALAGDACGLIGNGSPTHNAPSSFPVGVTDVVWTATDPSGNSSTCIEKVTVTDNQNPTITCPANVNTQVDPGGSCYASSVNLGTPTSADNCAGWTVAHDAPAEFPLGSTAVRWTATDASGNTATCTQTVNVSDPQHTCQPLTCGVPTARCRDLTRSIDENQTAVITAADINDGSTASSGCTLSGVTISRDGNTFGPSVSFACFELGQHAVTLRVTQSDGQTATCTASVTINDQNAHCITTCAAPVARCRSGVVRSLAGTSLIVTATEVDDASTAAAGCSISSVQIKKTNGGTFGPSVSFGCGELGTQSVTLRITQSDEQFDECTTTLQVVDDIPPTFFNCASDRMVNPDQGQCTASGVSLGSPNVTDSCGLANGSPNNDAPSTFPPGVTVVTWTAADTSGNTATCVQFVTVENTTPPTITCPAAVQVNVNGPCEAGGVNLGTPVASDDCDTPQVGNNAPSTFPVGHTQVTWTATDSNGNSATCLQQVTVNDLSGQCPVSCGPPTVQCHATLNRSLTGNKVTIQALELDNGSSPYQGCSISSRQVKLTQDGSFASSVDLFCNQVGVRNLTLRVIQSDGQWAECTCDVTVVDDTPPIFFTCASDRVISPSPGSCSASGVNIGSPTVTDSCGLANGSPSNDAPTSFPPGLTVVTWSASDTHGNSATCKQNVTVTNTPPTITQGNGPLGLTVSRNSTCPGASNQVALSATDPEHAVGLIWTVATQATRGLASFVGTSSGPAVNVCYQPNPDELGSDSFVVQVDDGCGGLDSIQVNVTIVAAARPALNAAVSRKTHTNLGARDIDLMAGHTECRMAGLGPPGGTGTLLVVATFDRPVSLLNGGVGAVTSDIGTVGTVTGGGTSTLSIPLSGVPLVGKLQLAFPGVADASLPNASTTSLSTLCVRVVVGDYNNNGRVNFMDAFAVKNAGLFGTTANSGSFRADCNLDGEINYVDLYAVKHAGLEDSPTLICP